MPTGVILSSASEGATEEDVKKVLTSHGLEVEEKEPETPPEVVEPKRDDFETDEDFEAARVEWEEKQETPEEKEEAEHPAPRKLSRRERAIERATAELKEQNAALQKRLEALEKGDKKEEARETNPRPVRANFGSNEEYEDALLRWGVEKATADQKAREAVDAQKAFLEANLKRYRAQVEEFRDAHEDWDEVVNQDIPMHREVQLAVIEQENAAQVIYYLGKHPTYAESLAEMSPLSAVMEVGRLSARLKTGVRETRTANSGEKPKPRPRAPEPVRPVSTSAASSALTSRDAATKGDFQAFKAAQRAGR
jgi:hypothetical protein